MPDYLSESDVVKLLAICAKLNRPPFRASLYRVLVLFPHSTGIRFGEALRLRMRDVDARSAVLFIETFMGGLDGFRFIAACPANWTGTCPNASANVADGRRTPGSSLASTGETCL